MTLLVTGFGAFPGMPRNPSGEVVKRLARHRAAFARKHIVLSTKILPVLYDFCAGFSPAPAPDVVVHIGVAGRRREVSIETVAHNRRSSRHPDASGRAPSRLRSGAAARHHIRSEWNARAFATAMRRAGVPASPSRDAGSYVCNALLYSSLERKRAALFIHVPSTRICEPDVIARALARTLPDVVTRFRRKNLQGIAG